jgi:hypothetical protein
MSKLIEFLFGSILITVSTIALIFFSTLHYVLKTGGISGCAWHGSAKAWIDSNHNGLLNQGEPPLSNVAIHIDDRQNDLVDVGWPAVTDKSGNAQLIVSIPNCSKSVFEIYADFPEGFRVTTPPRLDVTRDFSGSLSSGTTYYFGFISDR